MLFYYPRWSVINLGWSVNGGILRHSSDSYSTLYGLRRIKTPEKFNISNRIYLSNKPRPKAIAKAIAFGRGNLTLWCFCY